MVRRLGRYEILSELGRGAMGTVFQARDPRIDRVVAIKTITVAGSESEEAEQYRQRFFREAQAAGKLSAPGIVTIHDVAEDEETQTPFIVMEYVAGNTLDQFVAGFPRSQPSLETTLDLIQQIAEALDYAHAQGIVHRDIKPANIIVTQDGHTKIADFGIAKLTLSEFTVAGQVLGTPAYMSPEQLSGGTVDGRSDLFSLGVIAYWLFTGQKPFAGDTATTVAFKVVYQDPIPATQLNPSLSPDCEYILLRALAKDPAGRYQRGRELAADIQDIRLGRAPRSRSQSFTTSSAEKTVLQKPSDITMVSPPATQTAPRRWLGSGWMRYYSLAVRFVSGIFSRVAPLLPAPLRRPIILYPAVGILALALCSVALVLLHEGSGSAATTNLQIIGQHSLRSGQISIRVDDELRYQGPVSGTVHKHRSLFRTTYAVEGTIALTLRVPAGKHTVRVNLQSGEDYNQTKSIDGDFALNVDKTLRLTAEGNGLNLDWE